LAEADVSRDEFQIIQRYFALPDNDPDVLLGIGDDAAVVNASGPLAIATDTLVDGVHFPKRTAADAIGYRVLAVNLSDLAAMGARPRWCTLALTLADADEQWLEAFTAGFFQLAAEHGVSLVGGDLSRGPLSATLHLIGSADMDALLTRGGGHVGDDIYVTGSIGDAAAGLALINESAADAGPEHRALADRFYRPTPRVAEGRALAGIASAAIDVSDGLLADLGHICAASDCGAVIDVEQLPLSAELLTLFPPQIAQAYALGGGDDYELCFTAAAAKAQAVEAALEGSGASARRIGELVSGTGVECRRDGNSFTPAYTGHRHF
jgi:thiamine-monophosphate kinase